ncbi:MAG: hypothetical protein HYY96_14395 [Candidatus Tectomicrobia bacterium]|nr:hypothetical protein [Candidatus Tectomicrobia bacterium]
MQTFRTKAITWTVRSGRLIHETSPLKIVAALVEAPDGTVLKDTGHRRLVRKSFVDDCGHTQHVAWKEYRYERGWAELPLLVRASHARREWRLMNTLLDRGVAVPTPIALGERWQGGMVRLSIMIMEWIPDSLSLHEFADGYRRGARAFASPAAHRRFLEELGAFIASIHAAGFRHRDLHAGNILVQLKPAPRFSLIDLHRASMTTCHNDAARIRALAQLNIFFSTWARRSDGLRFLAAYRRALASTWSLRELATAVGEATARLLTELIRRRERRCLEANDEFAPLPRIFGKGFYRRDAGGEILEVLANPDAFYDRPQVELVKNSRSTRLARGAIELQRGPASVYLKRYNSRHLLDRLKNLLRPARALRAWRHAQALRLRQIATPLPIAALACGRGPRRGVSYLITEEIAGGEGIDRYVLKTLAGPPSPALLRRKRAFLEQVALFVRTLHQRGILHHDFKAANLLVLEPPGQPPRFILIDLDRVSFRQRLSRRQRQRNLAKINTSFLDRRLVSTTDRWRFLSAYLRYEPGGRQTRKVWWRALQRASTSKLKKSRQTFS